MKTMFRAGLAASLALVATAGHAAQTVKQQTCLTSEEASALFLSVAPGVLGALVKTCGATLPANAYLRTDGAALIARYVGPAAAAKPAAITAFNKISGEAQLTPDMFDMIANAMIGEIAVGKIKPADCPKIDRVAALLDPLPPSNFAGLVATIIEFAGEDSKKESPLKICKSA